MMGCGLKKVGNLLAELDSRKGIGLITRIRQGLGRPDRIYVRKCTQQDMYKRNIQTRQNDISGNAKMTGTDMSLILPSDGSIETARESSLNDTGKEKSEETVVQTEKPSEPRQPPTGKEEAVLSSQRRISSRQRKLSLDEYRKAFLQVPRIEDRKPVFVSGEVRDRLDEFVRRLGGRKMSVSGLLENIARQHLEIYSEDFEQWRKL